MQNGLTPLLFTSRQSENGNAQLVARFALAGAFAGIGLGIWEAALIYFVPSARPLSPVDSTYVIWFVAVLTDVCLFGLLGAAVGLVPVILRKQNPKIIARLVGVLAGAVAAWIGLSLRLLHHAAGNLRLLQDRRVQLYFAGCCAMTLLVAPLATGLVWKQISPAIEKARAWPIGRMAKALLAVIVVLIAGLAFYELQWRWELTGVVQAQPSSGDSRPNIILITLDTVRADHLSAYGYGRPTTPHLDRMASQGVLFKNAVAPSSWTLPSLASISTGLLPHQHGADTGRAMDPSLMTLAKVLGERGYAVAGYNANDFYGQTGWGIGMGFDPYDDDRTTLGYNLARTVAGRVGVEVLYEKLRYYDVFYRRSAQDVNRDVFRWFHRRSPGQPYFLFINYFDAHSTYMPPAPYDRRFGTVREDAAQLIYRYALDRQGAVSPQQRASLIDGYDNCLAYLDDQVAKLIEGLSASPDWSNSIVIITADHGEAFGEHGVFTHGADLHREVLHVPLIVFGRGIPSGLTIDRVANTRALFPTVLNLALGKDFPLPGFGLARYWDPGLGMNAESPSVVSELDGKQVSLTTTKWQYIRSVTGKEELYQLATDPQEQHDLSSRPEYLGTRQAMRDELEDKERRSLAPWFGPEYLEALNDGKLDFFAEYDPAGRLSNDKLKSGLHRAGLTQAIFNLNPYDLKQRPAFPDKELLRTLPYQ